MNSSTPEISIIIPVYNISSYLDECIESISRQSFSNYEVIIIDDGSTDGSGDVCDQYKKYQNYRVIHTENMGAAHARNIGLEYAKGKYIAFIDGDDAISEDYLEILYKEIEQNRVDIVACCCRSIGVEEVDHFFEKDIFFSSESKIELIYQLIEMRYGQPGPYYYTGIGVPWGKLYNREFIEKYNLKFDNNLRRLQDNMFNMYAFHYADNIKYINQPLYLYRRDHIMSMGVKYNNNLSNNSITLINARKKAIDELGYSSNNCIIEKFNGEVFKYYREILKNIAQYYPNKDDRYRLFSMAFNFEEDYSIFEKYVEVVKPASNWSICGRKLELWLIRHKRCLLLYVFLRLKKSIKRID